MSAIDEFATTLEALLSVKPPGVSGSKIRKLHDLAINNVTSESVLIQRLYTHCKVTPPSHKLGALYVVDSIVRGYQDKAKELNEPADAPEGTYAAGVQQITELIGAIMDDAFTQPLPGDQKDKIKKLVDIWARAETFPAETIKSLYEQHFKPEVTNTPPGSPPSSARDLFNQATTVPRAHSPALVAEQQQVQPPKPAAAAPPDTASILQALASIAKQKPQAQSSSQSPPQAAAPAPIQAPLPPVPSQSSNSIAGQPWNLAPQQAASSTAAAADPRSRVDRSRSPNYERRRSRSPTVGHQRSPNMRSRSPQRSYSQSGVPEIDPADYKPRNVKYGTDIPQGCIRVTSRTLFVGGVPPYMNEQNIADQFSPFARVQSMIFHKERKHAFVKILTREEAEIAKEKFEELNRSGGTQLRARWGVGFGPRDCCDYQSGVSVIPIDRLTDADKRWIVTADNGGTGGRPLVSGIEVEEPDIEIGSGVSSKAISKRMPTNSSRNGPRSTRDQDSYNQPHRRHDRNDRNDRNDRHDRHDGGGWNNNNNYNRRNQGGYHNNNNNNNNNGGNYGNSNAIPAELSNMINAGGNSNNHYLNDQQQQQYGGMNQQQPGMPPQMNPMQMMQMFQSGQVPPQFQQMAAFFQQQQQQQQQQNQQ